MYNNPLTHTHKCIHTHERCWRAGNNVLLGTVVWFYSELLLFNPVTFLNTFQAYKVTHSNDLAWKWHTAYTAPDLMVLKILALILHKKWQGMQLIPRYWLVWPLCSLMMKSFIDPSCNCYPLDCCKKKVTKSANWESHFTGLIESGFI